ncbi:hypothetical protein ACPV3S_20340 [Photobacterium damselae]|uniref:hypothetical protein n=1 Tax=Photobacterium damselae TaxID=38293 RepID=UPI004068762B
MKVSSLSMMAILALSHSAFGTSDVEETTTTNADTQSTGLWIGVGLGMGRLDDSVPGNAVKENSSAFSAKLNGGYDFNEYFGVYGSYDFYQR